jgi:hypothetical protein
LNRKSKLLIHKNNYKVKLVKLNKCKSNMAGVIIDNVVDDVTIGIQITMDQDNIYYHKVSTLSLIVTFTIEFKAIYYTHRKMGLYFFCVVKLEGMEFVLDVF